VLPRAVNLEQEPWDVGGNEDPPWSSFLYHKAMQRRADAARQPVNHAGRTELHFTPDHHYPDVA
jgi:hypothetical protein